MSARHLRAYNLAKRMLMALRPGLEGAAANAGAAEYWIQEFSPALVRAPCYRRGLVLTVARIWSGRLATRPGSRETPR
jgi:hypothetical protein